jgi:drug/metabolite transporter (DMT)-like permease
VAVAFALLAALTNAIATLVQRAAVHQGSGAETSARLMARLVRRPLWLLGLALMASSFPMQAIALNFGSLSTVQPIIVTELVFLVAIYALWYHEHLGWRGWGGCAGTAIGLGLFLAISGSGTDRHPPSSRDWVLASGLVVVAIVAGWLIARRGSPAWRATWLGVAAGLSFALSAAYVKAFTNRLSAHGYLSLLSHFEIYGIIVTGLVGLVLVQQALAAGPVAASQSALLTVNPIASIALGVLLFGDQLATGTVRITLDALALAVMCSGLLVLASSPLVAAAMPEGHEAEAAEKESASAPAAPG